jgi:hypothetical protein
MLLAGALVASAVGLAGSAHAASSSSYFTALPALGNTELQTARVSAVAAPLPDGRVLIAGGLDATQHGTQSAELFDPTSDTFTPLPASGNTELQTPREGPVGAALPDGRVLIAGGVPNGPTTQSAELFDPASDTFTALPASGSTELQTPREAAVAAVLPDGQVLIAGGNNDSGNALQSAELFDPASDTFTALPASGITALQTPRDGAVAAALPDGQVLIAGGENSSSNALQSAELFDPASDTFTALPASGNTELHSGRDGAVAAALPDGQVLIAGGYNSDGNALQSAELFDPASDTFTALPASGNTELQTARGQAVAAALPDGRVLIASGNSGVGFLQSAELFVPAPEARVAGGDFGAQTVAEPSALQTLTITNLGAQALRITGDALGGSMPGDFEIANDACSGRTLAFEQTCTLTVRFTPTTAGARTATIQLSDNEPTPEAIPLSGTGVPANHGPQGTTGQQGPPGQNGAQGPPGRIELVVCKKTTRTTTKNGKKHTSTVQHCTARLVSGPVKFTINGATLGASVSRAGVTYATGLAVPAGTDRWHLVLTRRLRTLRPGRYSLTLRSRHGARRVLERRPITIK